MKKILASLLAVTLLFSPVGNFIFDDEPTAEAKRFKSGKKGFNMDRQKAPTNSNIKKEKDKQKDTNPGATNKGAKSSSGGMMKGLFLGGLAGMLFGGLLANMGALGPIVGMMINVLAILLLALLIKKVISMLFSKKKKEDDQKWQH